MFDEKQKAELAKGLDSRHVKPAAPGKYGEYIEGWRTIDEANRIFGFDGWSRETVILDEKCRELVELPGRNNGPPYKQWRVGYFAKVRVHAGGISREGCGFGHGQGKPEGLGDAIESAIKEAETDAMKRALMTFGNPFGLALYDKTKANVIDVPAEESAELKLLRETLSECRNSQDCKDWLARNRGAAEGLNDQERGSIQTAYNETKARHDAAVPA